MSLYTAYTIEVLQSPSFPRIDRFSWASAATLHGRRRDQYKRYGQALRRYAASYVLTVGVFKYRLTTSFTSSIYLARQLLRRDWLTEDAQFQQYSAIYYSN